MNIHIKPRRRWISYSLRTFFLLLTVFGIWLGVQVKWIHDRRESRAWAGQRGWDTPPPILYDDTKGIKVSPYVDLLSTQPQAARKYHVRFHPGHDYRPLPWSLELLGATPSGAILLDQRKLSDTDLKHVERLKALFPEADIIILPSFK